MINWNNITAEGFEELCYLLLEQNEFCNLQWYGKGGGDKGRDIIAEKVFNPFSHRSILQKWLCQCKRYTSKSLTKSELSEAFSAAQEHHVDYLLIIVTETLSSNLKDWIETVKKDYRFDVVVWEELDIRREVNRNLTMVAARFPELIRQGNAVRFYECGDPSTSYMCNQFDEIGFYVMNDAGHEENIKMINEFIYFIKSNDITFDPKS